MTIHFQGVSDYFFHQSGPFRKDQEQHLVFKISLRINR